MSLCQCCYVVMSQVWTRLKQICVNTTSKSSRDTFMTFSPMSDILWARKSASQLEAGLALHLQFHTNDVNVYTESGQGRTCMLNVL